MRYYIDTNILTFMVMGKEGISDDVLSLMTDYENIFLTSSVCVQELVHLVQIGKFRRKKNEDFRKMALEALASLEEKGVQVVPVTMNHIRVMANLPFYDDHRDPNDRLIISQAIADEIPLISSDGKFSNYTRYGLDFIYNER